MSGQSERAALFWGRMVVVADSIECQQVSVEELIGHLLSIDEGFAFDPAEDYHETVALLLCRAMRRRLEKTASDIRVGSEFC